MFPMPSYRPGRAIYCAACGKDISAQSHSLAPVAVVEMQAGEARWPSTIYQQLCCECSRDATARDHLRRFHEEVVT